MILRLIFTSFIKIKIPFNAEKIKKNQNTLKESNFKTIFCNLNSSACSVFLWLPNPRSNELGIF